METNWRVYSPSAPWTGPSSAFCLPEFDQQNEVMMKWLLCPLVHTTRVCVCVCVCVHSFGLGSKVLWNLTASKVHLCFPCSKGILMELAILEYNMSSSLQFLKNVSACVFCFFLFVLIFVIFVANLGQSNCKCIFFAKCKIIIHNCNITLRATATIRPLELHQCWLTMVVSLYSLYTCNVCVPLMAVIKDLTYQDKAVRVTPH